MKWLFAAGGTGGTVFPAIAVAKAIRQREPGAEILFVGTPRGFETRLVPQAGFRLELMTLRGLKRVTALKRLFGFLLLPKAFVKSWRVLKSFSPKVVVGSGGYASGPILLMATLLKIPTAVIEPNAVPGFANRVLARFVDRVFLAFEEARTYLPKSSTMVTGNPIREDILAVRPPSFSGEKRTVLVFGGSQGAQRINRAMIGSCERLAKHRDRLKVLHQTGAADESIVRAAYQSAGIPADVAPFIDNMAEAYRAADLVVARSGSSVLEIAACGRPSILIPFPHAADDHQYANAMVLQKKGAAVIMEDAECDGDRLGAVVEELAFDRERLERMSRSALELRKSDAAEEMIREMERMV